MTRYAGGRLIGRCDSIGLHDYFDEPLGTRRTRASGVLAAVYRSLPFGDGFAESIAASADDPTENHFTGKERDVESGNDYFGARYYNSTTGRFLSLDWSAKSDEPVPYAKLDNPQSLNLYAYAADNPLRYVDADGHVDVAAMCAGKPDHCNVEVQQNVNSISKDGKTTSTISLTTYFILTHDKKGKNFVHYHMGNSSNGIGRTAIGR